MLRFVTFPFCCVHPGDAETTPEASVRAPLLMRSIGDIAEELVAQYLMEHGLMIWGRNVRLGALELDIVAIDGMVVVVVEVRSRGKGAFQAPFETLSKTKRTRFLRAGERLWRRYFARDPRVERLRYDVAAVYRDALPTRIEYVRAALVSGGHPPR